MAVLGVFVGADGQSVCVAQEGRVLAAECADARSSRAGAGSLLETVRRCLTLAGTAEAAVEHLVITGETETLRPYGDGDLLGAHFPGAVKQRVTVEEAHLALLGSTGRGFGAALVITGQPDATATVARLVDGRVTGSRPVRGGAAIGWALRATAVALGCRWGDPVEFLEGIAGEVDEHTGQPRVVSHATGTGVDADGDAFARRVATDPPALRQASPHVAVQQARQGLAADILVEVADALSAAGSDWLKEAGTNGLTLAGGLFSSPAFVARMARRLDDVVKAPTAEDTAVALGAALSRFDRPAPLTSLAFGPAFDEQDVKAVLENCHLDYVYEPRWSRLLPLVSRLLSTGSLVAWFQGRSDFGLRSFGSRSILADPSAPFVRENVNSFLLGRLASAPLSVVVAPSLSNVGNGLAATERLLQAPSSWRSHLGQAIDKRGNVRVSVGSLDSALVNLLECHLERTGIGALVNVPLAGFVTPLAHTPREAIQAVFGSAADFLVIGRFVVAKDYRLLRSATA